MLYKFKTRNGGDVIMTQPVGDQVLKAAGREPAAAGVFEPEAMGAAIASIEAAIAAEEAALAEAQREHAARVAAGEAGTGKPPSAPSVSLRQRAWPLLEMLRRARADGERIVWGV